MKTYKELVNELYEEVSKIDVSKLSLASFGGGLKDYVELLKAMSSLPHADMSEIPGPAYSLGFGGFPVPKEESKEDK